MVVASEANSDRRPDPRYDYPASGAAVLLDLSPWRGTGFGAFVFHTRDEHADLYTSVVSLAEKRGRILIERRAGLEDAYLSMAGRGGRRGAEPRRPAPGRDRSRRSRADIPRLPDPPAGGHRLSAHKVVDLSGRLPDTLSTSLFLALKLALAERQPAPGQKALLLACRLRRHRRRRHLPLLTGHET